MEAKEMSTLPWIISPTLVSVPLKGWRTERPVINWEKCCQCGTCFLYCPTGCVVEKAERFEINLDFCKGCGTCARECPIEAITMIEETEE